MRELTTLERVTRAIRAGTGEEYGDGYVVTDVAVGYAEPGYGADDTVIVFGNWNPKRWPRADEEPLAKADNLGPRLADAIEHAGGQTEWLDEWGQCADCHRAMRTAADSYGWTMFGAWSDDELMCADCLKRDLESNLSDYIDATDRAVTWCSKEDLRAAGWTQYAPDDPHTYESGWHPHQTDDPTTILATIKRENPTLMVLFHIDDVGQFDIRFSAFTKEEPAEWGTDDE